MDRNKKTQRESSKKFSCNFCSEQFTALIFLKIHLAEGFCGAFKCYICGLHFRKEATLDNHIRTHTLEKPFKCKNYLKNVRNSKQSKLAHHMRSRHSKGKKEELEKNIKDNKHPSTLPEKEELLTSSNNAQTLNFEPIASTSRAVSKNVSLPLNHKKQFEQNEKNNTDLPIPKKKTPSSKKSKKCNFTPIAYWYQCRICKVCIHAKEAFLFHKITKHPESMGLTTSQSEASSSDDDDL